jgi:hypothetical protein
MRAALVASLVSAEKSTFFRTRTLAVICLLAVPMGACFSDYTVQRD